MSKDISFPEEFGLTEERSQGRNDLNGKFMQDEGLKDLLRQWRVPETPASLANRVAAAYQQSSSQTLSVSALYSQRDSEVVNMKFYNTCQEEFAEKFRFCPAAEIPSGTGGNGIYVQNAVAGLPRLRREREVLFECADDARSCSPFEGLHTHRVYMLPVSSDKMMQDRVRGGNDESLC